MTACSAQGVVVACVNTNGEKRRDSSDRSQENQSAKLPKSVQKEMRIDNRNEGMYVGEPKGMVKNVGMLSKTQRDKSAERRKA